MKKLYLHIGVWKTGTTSIQHTLYSNKATLLQSGVCYPDIGSNHAFLASAFHDEPESFIVAKSNRLSGKDLSNWHESSLQQFKAAVSEADISIVSSEFLLDLSRKGLQNLKAYLQDLFGDILVIAYIKHPVDHVASAVNEQVKQGHYDIEKAYSIHSRLMEYEKIERWMEVFGSDSFILKPYDRMRFVENDLMTDFLAATLGSNTPKLKRLKTEPNKSLSYEALLIANSLAEIAPAYSKKRGQSHYLHKIPGEKFKLPRRIQDVVIENSNWFFDKYDNMYDLGFDFGGESYEDPNLNALWGADTIDALAKILNEFSLKSKSNTLRDNDANYLRDIAIKIEAGSELTIDDALALMELAARARPEGPYIQEKILQYRSDLAGADE